MAQEAQRDDVERRDCLAADHVLREPGEEAKRQQGQQEPQGEVQAKGTLAGESCRKETEEGRHERLVGKHALVPDTVVNRGQAGCS